MQSKWKYVKKKYEERVYTEINLKSIGKVEMKLNW